MYRIRLLPHHWLQHVGPSFRYVTAIFTLLFAIIILLMIVMEMKKLSSTAFEDIQDRKLRRKHQQPTNTHDNSLHYAVVIDCGSSGSRVFIYYWPKHTGNAKDLLSIQPLRDKHSTAVHMKIEPGLSDLAHQPNNATNYIKPLLNFALHNIPKGQHKETLLYVLATAGMRLLPESEQSAIMNNLRTNIPSQYPFSDTQFEVITGKQEGVYTWVAINYVLGKYEHGYEDEPLVAVTSHGLEKIHMRRRTVGILDMGGASVQIAYEVPQSIQFDREDTAKGLMAEVSLGCRQSDIDHQYSVYVATFLGQGANSARQRYEDGLILKYSNRTTNGHTVETAIPDPCLPTRMSRTVYQEPNDKRRYLIGTGNYHDCRQSLIPLLNIERNCIKHPCTINGVFQPTINFYNSELYGFSEFWYTTDDILGIGGLYDHKKFDSYASEYCSTDAETLTDRFKRNMYPKASELRFNLQCFKSAWISAVLHDGFHIPRTYNHFYAVNLIDNQPVQWTLGALLHRARYIPLREIEIANLRQTPVYHARLESITSYLGSYIFAACIIVVILSIILYIRHLRSVSLRHTLGLHRVSSMSYLT